MSFLVEQIKHLLPTWGQRTVAGLYLWQGVVVTALIGGTLLLTWAALRVISTLSFATGKQPLQSFRALRPHIHRLAILIALVYAEPALELSEHPLGKILFPILKTVLVIVALWAMHRLLNVVFDVVSARITRKKWDTMGMDQLLYGIIRFLVLGGTLLIGLAYLFGLNIPGLLTKLSIGAGTLTAVVALASKDLITNFFGALIITIGKPFRVGDWIVVGGIEGRVVALGMRATEIQTAMGTSVYVPLGT